MLLDHRVPENPWVYFLIFFCALTLLSQPSLSVTQELWVVVMGLVLPFVLFLNGPAAPAKEIPPHSMELFSIRGLAPWLIPGALALFIRSVEVVKPGRWANGDDVYVGMMGLDLVQWGHWDYFWTLAELPILPPLFSGALLRIGASPAFSLYFPAALFSTLTLPMAYLASRQFFSRSLSFLILGAFAFGYWPLLLVRASFPFSMFVFWEVALIYTLGRFLRSALPGERTLWIMIVGIVAGFGPWFCSPIWLVVDAWGIGLTLARAVTWKPFTWRLLAPFLASLVLSFLPFEIALYQEGYGHHMGAVSFWRNPSGLLGQARIVAGYLSAIFCGNAQGIYVPVSGGFQNPVSGALFLLGLRELFRVRRLPFALAFSTGLAAFLLPGFLSKDLEGFRVLAFLPLALALSSMGLNTLLQRVTPSHRVVALVLSILLLSVLDLHRFDGSIGSFWRAGTPAVPSEEQASCNILERLSRQQGPGYILSEMVPGDADHSLTYFSSPFNACLDRRILAGKIQWLAVFTEGHLAPGLTGRFPSSRWIEFPAGQPGQMSRHQLGIFPIDPQTRPFLEKWKDFYAFYQEIDLRIFELKNGVSRSAILTDLAAFYPSIPDDSFLRSCFFGKLAFNYSWEKAFHPEDTGTNWAAYGPIFKDCMDKGVQDADLYEKYGKLLASEERWKEARQAFRTALKYAPGNPWLIHELNEVDLKK